MLIFFLFCSDQFSQDAEFACSCGEDDAKSSEAQLRGSQTQVPSLTAAGGALLCRDTGPDGQRGGAVEKVTTQSPGERA